MQPFNQLKYAACGNFVQVAGWIVSKQQARIANQRAGQRHTLLFTA